MSEHSKSRANQANLTRRSFLYGSAAALATLSQAATAQKPAIEARRPSPLKRAAMQHGILLGAFTGKHQLLMEPAATALLTENFSMIAVGNDLKFTDRLSPSPTTYDFSFGDTDVAWAEQHHMLFRGHCLIWWNALPKWFGGYVNAANARQVMNDHITSVVGHYAGRIYSWDVVNEPIHHDGRPDDLRRKPWLELVGPDYIDIAFHTAHAADPKARLVLNECFIEHNSPLEIQRRASLLALATRLKHSGVPITTIGIQGHLRGTTPIDTAGMTTFMKQIHDLGLEIMITELDVDDTDVPAPLIRQTVANKYREFVSLVAPYVKVITLEGLRNDPSLPKRPDGLAHLPNIFDEDYQKNAAYDAIIEGMSHARAV